MEGRKMINNYDETIKYWDNVFGQSQEYNPTQIIQVQEIENGIRWLVENSKSTIDFGCGNGRIIFRCLDKGMEYVYGIDICNNAIEIANSVIKKFDYSDKADMVCGGLEKLNQINDNSFESAILFNILDNLTPEDSMELIKNIHRIVKSNGKILLKLNPYITKQQREEYKFKEISHEFYKEDSGLYLWNLTNEMAEKIIDPFFVVEKYEEIEFKQYNMINRMYYLRNR
jgi:arsenite methyltransferase